jgi:hypothetical protein
MNEVYYKLLAKENKTERNIPACLHTRIFQIRLRSLQVCTVHWAWPFIAVTDLLWNIYLSICLSVCLSGRLSIYPSIRPSVCVSLCLSICGSTALVNLVRSLSFLIYTQSVRPLGLGISPSQGRYLHTEQHNHRINAHKNQCLEWIRTHDPSARASEGGSCLRPRGHCDRPLRIIRIYNC